MEFKVKDAGKIMVTAGEANYEIKTPRMFHQLDLEKRLKNTDGGEHSSALVMIDWVASLGMPREVLLDMEQATFLELFNAILGVKKS